MSGPQLLPVDRCRAGRISQFVNEWEKITSDIVKHGHIEFDDEFFQSQTLRGWVFSHEEEQAMSAEVNTLISKGVIEKEATFQGNLFHQFSSGPKKMEL